MKFIKKTFFNLTIGFFILFLCVSPALADFDWPSPSEAAREMTDSVLSQYNVDTSAIAEQTQLANVLKLKKSAPQVSITFNPSNPVPGEKVTATAQPENFGNSMENMYFTWYIRHEDQKDDDDIELFKTQAMRIIASSGFDWEEEAYNSDSDDDGYKASLGGDDQKEVGKESHCFFHDTEKGKEYEFRECKHLFPDAPDNKTGDGEFNRTEEKYWRTDPNDPDTGDYGQLDEATVAGLGQNAFTWTFQEGDEVGVAVEGISYEPTSYSDSSYKIMWALPKNKCDLIDDAFDDPAENTEQTVTVSPEIWPSCPDGCTFTRTVTKETTTYEQAPYSSYQIGTTVTEVKTEQIQIHALTSITGGTATATGGATPTATVDITTETSEAGEAPSNETCYAIDEIEDGSTITDRSCCPDDSEYCSVLSSRTETNNESKSMDIDKEDSDQNLFKMTMDDFDKCLIDNFVSPVDGGGAHQKINVDLSYFPENPINDPSDNNSDELTVNASVTDYDDAEFLYYTWEVYTGNSTEGPWEQLTKSELTDATNTMGIGLNELKFRLNLEDADYIKVKVKLTEKAYNGNKKGNEEIIIPLNNNSYRIKVFPVDISSTLSFTPQETERCYANGTEDPICEVSKNQILAVRVDDSNLNNFSWSVDGKSLSGNYNTTSESETNPAYFLVDKEIGDTFNVSLSATDTETGEKVNLTRAFRVVDPDVKIISTNNYCKATLLGYYTDSDGKEWEDRDLTNLQAASNQTLTFKAYFSGPQPAEDEILWYLDGTIAGTGSTISLDAGDAGDSHTLSVTSTYYLSDNTVKALEEYWNKTESLFYEQPISDQVNIDVLSTTDEIASQRSSKVVASLFASIPSYLAFIFRMILISFLFIFSAKIILKLSKLEN